MKLFFVLLLTATLSQGAGTPMNAIAYFEKDFIWLCIPVAPIDMVCAKVYPSSFQPCIALRPAQGYLTCAEFIYLKIN